MNYGVLPLHRLSDGIDRPHVVSMAVDTDVGLFLSLLADTVEGLRGD